MEDFYFISFYQIGLFSGRSTFGNNVYFGEHPINFIKKSNNESTSYYRTLISYNKISEKEYYAFKKTE